MRRLELVILWLLLFSLMGALYETVSCIKHLQSRVDSLEQRVSSLEDDGEMADTTFGMKK